MFTDVLGDRVFRLVALTDLDAARMWRSPRAAPLLTGYRGSAVADTAALEEVLLRLGLLAEHHPQVAELDLNPVISGPGGVVAVDATARLVATASSPTLSRGAYSQPPDEGHASRDQRPCAPLARREDWEVEHQSRRSP
ncbi:hypothetical protein GCM10009682_28550 [Luedemannella flava]|uniref:ATP-grasp domain-containing protein n=1 Tax=Luedemannella flava TaxID=349316 RepID=A0ABN2M032_9ACTN